MELSPGDTETISDPHNEDDPVDSTMTINEATDVLELTQGSESLAETEFACSVCLHIVMEPTTLNCGHTSCRLCLATWYFNSKKKECPMCRQPYHGYPMINTQLRNLLERLCPEQITAREAEFHADEYSQDIVKKYNAELSKEAREAANKSSDITSFCSGFIIAICLFMVAYLAWYWQSSDSTLLVKKPVQTWRPADVSTWLTELGWSRQYASIVREEQIDGNMLLSFDEESLRLHLNMTNDIHEKALMFAIDMLREQGIKMPATLWEYKAVYPGRCLFLVYGMKDFPRTSLLYMWVYFYDEMFLPFVQATTGIPDEALQLTNSTQDTVTAVRWMSFLFYTTVMPEWLVAAFTFQMFDRHTFSPLFVLATAFLCTILEILNWISFFTSERRAVSSVLKVYVKQLMSAVIFMFLWPIVPSLICDIFFYGALYISPVHTSMEVYKKLRALN